MKTIEDIWLLLNPQGEFKRRRGACERLWQGYSPELQQRIYDDISEAMAKGTFVNQNPYFAIEDTAIRLQGQLPRRQILSFDEYYTRFGTTEEQDGWRREYRPDEQRTVYIK